MPYCEVQKKVQAFPRSSFTGSARVPRAKGCYLSVRREWGKTRGLKRAPFVIDWGEELRPAGQGAELAGADPGPVQ